jgi:uncharacterized membrane protein YraQ (UPF0718 family)
MSSCCEKGPDPVPTTPPPEPRGGGGDCCGGGRRRRDWLLIASIAVLVVALGLHLSGLAEAGPPFIAGFCHSVADLAGMMWWGTLAGIVAIAFIRHVPRRRIERWLGRKGDFRGLARAVAAGVLFDLCSHGILLVAMQLYRKGLGLGQTVAFLVASPWNSFSMTFVLFALVGVKWTLAFLFGSLVVAFLSGLVFDWLERSGRVPANPWTSGFEGEAASEPGFRESVSPLLRRPAGWLALLKGGLVESRMVVRWMLFGVILASVIRVAVPPDAFANWFGPTMAGLLLTLLAATIIEVCSEGSSPIAADLLHRAAAPGNGFAFLMAGAATDYTEILALRETTRSWRIALLLPAVTVPQVVLLAWLMNRAG